jgi:hypothetical protein
VVCARLAALGFSSWQRAIISHAGQTYVLEHSQCAQGDSLCIVTEDLRGKSVLELPLNGKVVEANDGDDGARVCRSISFPRGSPQSVVVTESACLLTAISSHPARSIHPPSAVPHARPTCQPAVFPPCSRRNPAVCMPIGRATEACVLWSADSAPLVCSVRPRVLWSQPCTDRASPTRGANGQYGPTGGWRSTCPSGLRAASWWR